MPMLDPVSAYLVRPPRWPSISSPSRRREQPTIPTPRAKVASSPPGREARVTVGKPSVALSTHECAGGWFTLSSSPAPGATVLDGLDRDLVRLRGSHRGPRRRPGPEPRAVAQGGDTAPRVRANSVA